jgi:formylglycine-generating enzyme required for sulfatase activity
MSTARAAPRQSSKRPIALKYRAFISYSHADTGWAKWLQRGLEGFKIDQDLAGRETARGPIPKTLRPVFRDREDFTAGEELPEQTLAALDASDALIVICSPNSAHSNYVNEEARLFKSRQHTGRPVIPLIVGGKPGDGAQECFPASLQFRLDTKGRVTKKKAELLAADAREEGDGKELALAKVIAELLGLSSDEVFRRAERERRTARRLRRRVQIGFGALGWLLVFGGIAWVNQDYLRERWHWFVVVPPFILTQVQPYVLTPEAEKALKPKDTFRECSGAACPTMVVMPAGKFVMGSPPQNGGDEQELPTHSVAIAKPFAVSKYEVPFKLWDVCVAQGYCDPNISDSGYGRGAYPVVNLTWDHAKQYVSWLSRITGKPYRLLSEAEWEYAAHAGTQTQYSWGDDIGKGNANCKGCDRRYPMPMLVGSFAANQFGLHDMHGNVWEWVEDCHPQNYEGAPEDGSAWTEGNNCSRREVRGGGWEANPKELRATYRYSTDHESRFKELGFRVARDLDQ